jgi:hypothetical protein
MANPIHFAQDDVGASPISAILFLTLFPRFARDAVVLPLLTSFISAFPARRLVSANSKLEM